MINRELKTLRTKSEELDLTNTEEILEIRNKLIEELKSHPTGAGLAAIQIGISKRIFIYQSTFGYETIINPKVIIDKTKGELKKEGCLSLPNIECAVYRYTKLNIEYYSFNHKNELKKYNKTCNGFEAHVIQHEMNHLDGILMLDVAESLRKDKIEKSEMIYEIKLEMPETKEVIIDYVDENFMSIFDDMKTEKRYVFEDKDDIDKLIVKGIRERK